MTPEEFVKCFYQERQWLLETYFNPNSRTDVSSLIQELKLDDKGMEKLRQILFTSIDDTMYTILLGLDGAASIGNKQVLYKLYDENEVELTGGDIEVMTYKYFHDNKFEIDKGEADFIATLTYLKTEEGGRVTPAISGYRPQIKFPFDQMQTSGQQMFIDRKIVFPGDTVQAAIRILSVKHFAGRLKAGMSFEFREGDTLIGRGKIKHIVNPILEIKKP